jgi:formate hydrogenlyase subunit 3/multisubunit Na+/H+ antiporter MnhD subunit
VNPIILTVVLPLLTAFLLPSMSRLSATLARITGPAVLIVCAIITLLVWQTMDGNPFSIAVGGFLPPSGITFYIDQLSVLFVFAALAMVFLMWPWARTGSANVREFSLLLLLAAAACGLAMSGDLFNLYVFYELISIASFGLITINRNNQAYIAAFRYLVVSGFGTVMALTGIALVYSQTGTLNLAHLAQLAPETLDNQVGLAAFALILIGVGVKAELFPVNIWVPEVYATASSRISALLAGLVSKLAVLIIVRLLVLIFTQQEALQLLLTLGILGVISGELAAWRSRDFSRMLAYSSIGQLGIIFIAFSIPGEAGLFAGLALSLHHLIVKPALFLLAESWGGSLEKLRAAGKQAPLATAIFILLSLSLIGIPPLPGFWAKLLLVMGLAEQAQPEYLFALAVLLTATVIEANYLFRVATGLLHKPNDSTTEPEKHHRLDIATATALSAVLVTAVLLLRPISDNLQQTAVQAADREQYIQTVLPGPVRQGSSS